MLQRNSKVKRNWKSVFGLNDDIMYVQSKEIYCGKEKLQLAGDHIPTFKSK